jgi:hypothetical protein
MYINCVICRKEFEFLISNNLSRREDLEMSTTTTATTTKTLTPQEQSIKQQSQSTMKLEYLPKSPSTTATPEKSTANVNVDKRAATRLESVEYQRGQYLPPPENMLNFYDELNQNKTRSIDKVKKAVKSNPFVPLGCLITVGVLINGLIAVKNKDRVKSQRMMRYRIAAQGSTIIALIAGTLVSTYFYKPKE